jgi:20S proteasome alpha/beta subunit
MTLQNDVIMTRHSESNVNSFQRYDSTNSSMQPIMVNRMPLRRHLRLDSLLLYYFLLLLLYLSDVEVKADPRLLDGPSIVALKYRDGVVVASDARSPGSSYQPHRLPDSIRPIAHNVLIAASGGTSRASLQQQVARLQQQLADDTSNRPRTVRQLANVLRSLQQDDGSGGGGEVLLVGIEEEKSQMYILNHGALLEETRPFCVAGRESAFLAGCLERWKDDLEEAAAVEVCRQALQRISHSPIHIYILSGQQPLRHCIVRPGISITVPLSPSV